MSDFERTSAAAGGEGEPGGGQLDVAAAAGSSNNDNTNSNNSGTGKGPVPASTGGDGGGASSSHASYSAAADVEGGGGSEPLTAEETHAVLSEQPTGAEPSESEMGDRKDAQSSADNLLPTDKLENGLKHVSVFYSVFSVAAVVEYASTRAAMSFHSVRFISNPVILPLVVNNAEPTEKYRMYI